MKNKLRFLSAVTLACLAFASRSVADSSNDLENRCIDIQFQQEGFGNRTPREIKAFLDSQDIEAGVRSFLQTRAMTNPWFSLKVPHAYPRTIGIYQAIYFSFAMYGVSQELGTTPEAWLDQAIEFFSDEGLARVRSLTPYSGVFGRPLTPEQMRALMLAPRQYDESSLGAIMKDHPELVKLGCIGVDFLHTKKCANAINYAFKNLYDSGDTYNLGNGWLVGLMTSNQAEAGGFRLVRRMLQRIKSKDFTRASLIEDAYASFSDRKTAETFLLMGLVHGQLSWDSYKYEGLIQPYNFTSLVAAHVMSMLTAALDTFVHDNTPEKRIYVSPVGTKNVCDNGKPYHFLVPWYIARRLTENGYNKTIASKVPFIFDWMYQVFSQSRGRDPMSNVTEAYDSGRNQSHRMDLLFSAAGANLGAGKAGENTPTDFTDAFNSTQAGVSNSLRPVQTVPPPENGDTDIKFLLKIFKIGEGRFSPSALLRSMR